MNLTRYISINDRELRVTAEYYRTDFLKQTVVDIDAAVREVRFYDLIGKSFSNNYQLEMAYQLIDRFDISAAIRFTDVRANYGDQLLIKPLASKYKGLLTLSYATEGSSWLFDSSFLLNGDGRIPSTSENPVEYQREESFPAYLTVNAQVTKKIEMVDILSLIHI